MGNGSEVLPFREVLSEQAIRVFIGAALPGGIRMGEVKFQVQGFSDELMSYITGGAVEIGVFDIADIPLVAPTAGATVALPYTFQWTRRPATPSDTYEFDLYDPTDGNPNFYTAPPLGYVSSYTRNSLPPGFKVGSLYVWEMWVYSPDGGYGISYESRAVRFSNTGLSVMITAQPIQPKTMPDLGDRRKR